MNSARPRRNGASDLACVLAAVVVSRAPLLYLEGPDPDEDRPAHVRAASGLAWVGDELAVVQDDAGFLALHDPVAGTTRSLPLEADRHGKRLWDEGRGNKMDKPDLECATVIRWEGREQLLAMGSGSAPGRDRVLLLPRDQLAADAPRAPRALLPLAALYAALETDLRFSGGALNLEGVSALGGSRVRLFQRGNGDPGPGRRPVDAFLDLDLAPWLAGVPPAGPLPAARRLDLGSIGGVRLSFTDATPGPGGRTLFLAAAEDSPDAVRDGPVAGSVVGVLEPDGSVLVAPLVDRYGHRLVAKAEGIAWRAAEPDRVDVVFDPDDPERPSELCRVELRGPWGPGLEAGTGAEP